MLLYSFAIFFLWTYFYDGCSAGSLVTRGDAFNSNKRQFGRLSLTSRRGLMRPEGWKTFALIAPEILFVARWSGTGAIRCENRQFTESTILMIIFCLFINFVYNDFTYPFIFVPCYFSIIFFSDSKDIYCWYAYLYVNLNVDSLSQEPSKGSWNAFIRIYFSANTWNSESYQKRN